MPPSSSSSVEDRDPHTNQQPTSGRATRSPLPDVGPASERQTAQNVIQSRDPHATENTSTGEGLPDEDEVANMKKLPWWKRPSPYWLLCALPFTAAAASATLAPRLEVFTILACRLLRPDIYDETSDMASLPSILSPTRSQLCAADPVVQAAVAKLFAAMSTSMGILSCLTTGWWGAFSDRYGRPLVMGLSLIGLIITDFNYIFVTLFPDYAPGGYWFLLFGPLVEGSFGGFTGAAAAIHAYQADVTNDHNRSQFFSLGLGLIFVGTAIGPTLGSLIISSTGKLLSVFFATGIAHLLYALFIWTVLPQSLSLSYRLRARKKHAEELRLNASGHDKRFKSRIRLFLKRAFAFLSPLTALAPHTQENNNPLKRPRRDWNLTLIGLAYLMATSIMGAYNYVFQYAAATFGWTSEVLGYWLSLVGAARAVFLALILPVTIKILMPKPEVVNIPHTRSESTPLLSSPDSPDDSQITPTRTKEMHFPAFDLGLARVSVLIEIIAYIFMGLATTPIAFTILGMLASVGAGFTPAAQAVALALYAQRGNKESGRLFGALSVLQALGSQVLGPMLYGFVYVKTVATYPMSIFFVSVGTLVISALSLAFIRLRKEQFFSATRVTGVDGGPEDSGSDSHATRARSQNTELVGVEALL